MDQVTSSNHDHFLNLPDCGGAEHPDIVPATQPILLNFGYQLDFKGEKNKLIGSLNSFLLVLFELIFGTFR